MRIREHHVRVLSSLAGTTVLQLLGQLAGFAAGILIVRLLPVEQYAFYALAIATVGTAGALADSGATNATMARAGAVWQDRLQLGEVLAAGMRIRRDLALASGMGACLLLAWLVMRQQGSAGAALLLCLGVIPAVMLTSSSAILALPLRLHQRLQMLQVLEVATAALRLLVVCMLLQLWPAAWLVLLIGVAPQLLHNILLRRLARPLAELDAGRADAHMRAIRSQVLRSLPATFYYALSAHLTVLLISLFGSTEAVAQVGALGRLAMLANLMLAVFQLVLVPRFARMDRTDWRRQYQRFLQSLGLVGAAGALAVLVASAVPGLLLQVLGPAYAGLQAEVVLAIASGAMAVLASAAGTLAGVRGAVVSPWLFLSAAIGLQALLVAILPLDSVASMFWISIGVSFIQVVTSVAYFRWWIARPAARC